MRVRVDFANLDQRMGSIVKREKRLESNTGGCFS